MNTELSRHFKRDAAAAIVLTLVSGGVTAVPFAEIPDAVVTASADTMSGTVYYSQNTLWELDTTTGVLTFSMREGTTGGMASMWANFLTKYRNSVKKVVIGEGITSTSDFQNCRNLKSIEFPSTMKTVSGFSGCSALESVELPDSVEEIGSYAFETCTSLKSVKIPANLTKIGDYAFHYTALESVTIPDTVTDIGRYAFADTNIKTVTVPNGIETLYSTFSGCENLESVVLPNSVTSIDSVFYGCSALKSVTVPNGVTSMEEAFANCTSLETVNIPAGVTSLLGTFYNCSSLKSITVPASITDMKGTFEGCSSLETVNIPEGIEDISQTFKDCSSLKAITVPESVNTMRSAFEGCTSLETVNIPQGITELGGASYSDEGSIFKDCSSLKSIDIPNGVTVIGSSVFSGCSSLNSINLPDSITTIGSYAFSGCTGLTSVTFPENLTLIGWSAFENCTGLTAVTIPASVTEIQGYAFYGCSDLKSVDFDYNRSEILVFGDSSFGSLTEDVVLVIPRYSKGGEAIYVDYITGNPNYPRGSFAEFFGDAQVSIESNGVTYTKIEGIQPTCTESGLSEHYLGSDGKYYWDSLGYSEAEGYESEEDFIVSPTGHYWKAVSWIWKKTDDTGDYKAFVKADCYNCDIDVDIFEANVTSYTSDYGTTYYANISDYDNHMWLYNQLFIEAKDYTVTLDGEGCYITAATKKDAYRLNDGVTVVAAQKLNNQEFVGWYEGDKLLSSNRKYTFFVSGNITLTPKYADAAEDAKVVETFSLYRAGDYQAQAKFVNQWSLPEDCTLVEAGIIRAYDKDVTNLTPDNAAANGAKVNKSSIKKINGKYTLTVNMGYGTKQQTINAKGYIIYKNKKGETKTVMSDMKTSAYVTD